MIQNLVHSGMRFYLEVGREIPAPPETVWELLIDTWCWPQWGPSVRAVRCPDRRISAGSEGRVLTVLGLWLPFTITHFIPDHYWAWKVGAFRATGHRVRSAGAGRCVLVFEVPLPAAPYGFVCSIAASRLAKLAADSQSKRPRSAHSD
jgi:hypothetical protein